MEPDEGRMIKNDKELKVTQERIRYFENLLAQLRVTARPQEFAAVASGYRAEIERMEAEVLEYLSTHISAMAAAGS